MHQVEQCLTMRVDQRKPEVLHVVEMAVKRRRRDPGELRDLPETQGVEAPAGGQLSDGRVHKFLTGLFFLLFPG